MQSRLEAAVFGVRSFLAGPGASGVVVKIDASNAFNSISRAAIGRHSPLLSGYFVAAYAEPTRARHFLVVWRSAG